jgi:hypothetical protein
MPSSVVASSRRVPHVWARHTHTHTHTHITHHTNTQRASSRRSRRLRSEAGLFQVPKATYLATPSSSLRRRARQPYSESSCEVKDPHPTHPGQQAVYSATADGSLAGVSCAKFSQLQSPVRQRPPSAPDTVPYWSSNMRWDGLQTAPAAARFSAEGTQVSKGAATSCFARDGRQRAPRHANRLVSPVSLTRTVGRRTLVRGPLPAWGLTSHWHPFQTWHREIFCVVALVTGLAYKSTGQFICRTEFTKRRYL